MDVIAFILALSSLAEIEDQAAAIIAEYIEAHPEAIADVEVATVQETLSYLA